MKKKPLPPNGLMDQDRPTKAGPGKTEYMLTGILLACSLLAAGGILGVGFGQLGLGSRLAFGLVFLLSMAGLCISYLRNQNALAEVLRQDDRNIRHLNEIKSALNEAALISEADIRGNITFVNDQFCKISGYSPAELLGSNHRIVRSSHHPKEFYQEMWQTISAGRVWQGEICNRAKDGRPYWVWSTIYPIKDHSGKVVRYISIRFDVTGRKEAEQQILSATNAKSAFLANMSHEIRTPMNGVLGMAELLSIGELTERQRKYVDTIAQSGKSMLEVLNDILDFSKIESGKLSVENHSFNLHDMLNSLKILFDTAASRKSLTLSLNRGHELPEWIVSDPTRLRQIISNLLANAIKFTSKGSVTIVAGLKSGKDDQLHLYFAVKDTGRGIPDEKQETIFNSFTQEDTSTTRKFGGTGLGLTICRQLVNLLGGELKLRSEKGKGSTFFFSIPATRGQPAKRQEIPRTTLNIANPELINVLLVEDNEVNMDLATIYLDKFGLTCDTASNGLKAVNKLEQGNNYDIILMDCQMPVMDGYEATRRIRGMKLGRQPTIIAMTAHAMKGSRQECIDAGMDDYFTKPVSLRAIGRILEKWIPNLERSQQAKSPSEPPQTPRFEHLNWQKFSVQMADIIDLLPEYLEKVDGQIAELLDQIEVHLKNKRYEAVPETAHQGKGMVSNFYLTCLQEQFKTIEKCDAEQNPEQVRQMLRAIRSSWPAARKELDRACRELQKIHAA